MVAAAILNFKKRLPILSYLTIPHKMLCYVSSEAHFEMAATTMLNFEKLLLTLYYSTTSHQIWRECSEFDAEQLLSCRQRSFSKIQGKLQILMLTIMQV